MPAKIDAATDNETMTVYLAGEIDHHNARKMREDIDNSARLYHPKTLVLDFGGVEFMDSSGIGIVLGRYRLMQELGGEVCLQNMPSHIRKVMRVAGIDNLKVIDKTDKGGTTS